MMGMTQQEHAVYYAIVDSQVKSGRVPSFDEIKDAVGLKSKAGVHRILTQLEAKGLIRRLPRKARAIEVVGKDLRDVVTEALPRIRRMLPDVAAKLESALRA